MYIDSSNICIFKTWILQIVTMHKTYWTIDDQETYVAFEFVVIRSYLFCQWDFWNLAGLQTLFSWKISIRESFRRLFGILHQKEINCGNISILIL